MRIEIYKQVGKLIECQTYYDVIKIEESPDFGYVITSYDKITGEGEVKQIKLEKTIMFTIKIVLFKEDN